MMFTQVYKSILSLIGATTFASGLAFAADPQPNEILKDADRARGSTLIAEGISWHVDVTSSGDDGSNTISYELKVKGSDALAEAVAPARNKGELILFNGNNLWFFKSGLKKPVAISSRQKLMGQAANGDIANTNYARDYNAELSGSEAVDGKDCWRLELKAKEKNVTYDRIRLWVTKKDRLGVKSEFLTVGGDIFKRATFKYDNKMKSIDKDYAFVSEMVITDALNAKNVTTLKYKDPKPGKHSDSLFNVNNLVR